MRPAIVLVVLAACGSPPESATLQSRAGPGAEPPEPADPCGATGRWEPLPWPALDGRVDHTAVWTGSEMVVWGGTRGMRNPRSDGARFDAAATSWQPTAMRLAPLERDDHVAVWTGREMIVWGGNHYDEDEDKLADGGRYDPETDRWRPTPHSRLTPRDDPRAVWTGREMIVWGGRDQAGVTDTGARFDPAANRWRPVSLRGAPEPREDHTMVWTGTEVIVWGGWNGPDRARNYGLRGGRYDPRNNTWRPISTDGAPEPREDHAAIWTGREMIVWGGVVREPGGERHQLATGGRYDPATDTWNPLAFGGAPSPREDGVVVWTGREMVVWGGQRDNIPVATGARYVPARDLWCPMIDEGAPEARRDHAGVWTGRDLIVWGGRSADGAYTASGSRFTLAL